MSKRASYGYVNIGNSEIVHAVRLPNPLTLCNRFFVASARAHWTRGYGKELCKRCSTVKEEA